MAAWLAAGGVGGEAHAERTAPRGTLTPQLTLGAGYSDNLFLDAFPAGPLGVAPRADAIFDIQPRLVARLGVGGHSLVLSIEDLERLTISSGNLRDLDVHVGYRSAPLRGVEVLAGLGYGHWEASLYRDNRSDTGSASLGVRVGGARILDATIAMRGAVRSYPSRQQLDGEARPSAALKVRLPRRTTLEASYAFLHIASTEPRAELDRHSASVGFGTQPLDWFSLRADYTFSSQHLPDGIIDETDATGARDDLRHELHAVVVAQPLRWLEIFAEYDFLTSTSTDPAGRFRRNQVVCGLVAYNSFSRMLRRSLAPRIRGREVTFYFRGGAERASIVGDWNGWDPDAAPLRLDKGVFVGTYVLPPGRHVYAVSVDSTVESPPDATAYVSDGFGANNGVLVVR